LVGKESRINLLLGNSYGADFKSPNGAAMRYFCVEPEVAGGLGSRTAMNRNVHPPVVTKLHYHFDGWLGDGLLETFPVYLIVDNARRVLDGYGLTGFRFADVEITTSEEFQVVHPGQPLPKFAWLQVDGQAKRDDFGIRADGRLVVSERALDALTELGISNALVTPESDH